MTETERRILAAQGYVELSLYAEARVELTKLPEEAGGRVDVLEILLLCLMAESQWAEALALTMWRCAKKGAAAPLSRQSSESE
jgi:hypothetical protein